MPRCALSAEAGQPLFAWVLDTELPFIASKAAMELDDLGRGKTSTLKATRQLASILKSATSQGQESGTKGFIDPPSAAVFSKALKVAMVGRPLSSKDALLQAASDMAETLNSAGPDPADTSSISKLRDFCLELSRYSLTYRDRVFAPVPSHRYRK